MGRINTNHIMFTADVKSLYTNVPLVEGHKVIKKFIKNNRDKIDTNGMDLGDFDLVLKSVTQTGYFRFDSKFYQQLN